MRYSLVQKRKERPKVQRPELRQRAFLPWNTPVHYSQNAESPSRRERSPTGPGNCEVTGVFTLRIRFSQHPDSVVGCVDRSFHWSNRSGCYYSLVMFFSFLISKLYLPQNRSKMRTAGVVYVAPEGWLSSAIPRRRLQRTQQNGRLAAASH